MNSSNQALSIVHALETTNDVPSPLDQACLSSHLSTLNRKIDAINQDIQTLIAQRIVIAEESARCSRVLSSLRRLPAELLLEIFHHLWLERKSVAVHQLARACSSWRSIVLNTPLFWTSVVLRDERYYDHEDGEGNAEGDRRSFKNKDLVARLNYHIERSRDLPMALTMKNLHEKESDSLFHYIFSTVKAHWSFISLYATKISQMKQVVAYYRKFPNEVQYLWGINFTAAYVEGAAESALGGKADGILDFGSLSKLRSFRLHMRSFIDSRHLFKLNWAKLIHLRLGSSCTSKDYIIYILPHCPDLESLYITTNDPPRLTTSNLEMVTLKKLKTLTLEATIGIPSVLLLKLRAPFLEELVLHFDNEIPSASEPIMVFLMCLEGGLRIFRCTGYVLIHLFYFHQRDDNDFFKPLSTITTWRITAPYYVGEDDPKPINCTTLYLNFAYKMSLFPELKLIEFAGHDIDEAEEIRAMTALLSAFSKLGEGRRIISKQDRYDHPSKKLREYRERGLWIEETGRE